jgi:amino acid adenylation domain-containing protein
MAERKDSQVRLIPVDYDPFARPAVTVLPMTEAVSEMWAAVQMGSEASCSYNQCFPLRLTGRLDVEALRGALQRVVDRHAALRATFDAEGEQRIHEVLSIELPLVDLTSRTRAEARDELGRIMEGESREPFDLTGGPLIRARLVREDDETHVLVLTAHHIACDGWSAGVVLRDLAALYSANTKGLPASLPPVASYVDHVRAEMSPEAALRRKTAEDYWVAQFADLVPAVDLPADRPRPAVRTFAGGQEVLPVGEDLYRAIKHLGVGLGATLYVILLAGFQVLVHRLTGQTDLVIGIPVAGQARLENGQLVGHCVDTLPMRSRVRGEVSLADHVKEVRRNLLAVFENQEATFGSVVRRLKLPRDAGRSPLVTVTFNVDKAGPPPAFAGLAVEPIVPPKRYSAFELGLDVLDTGHGLSMAANYNRDLLDAATVRRWLNHYRTLLEAAVADPSRVLSRLPLEVRGERPAAELTHRREAHGPTLIERFQRQVAQTPDAPAVACEGTSLTYGELNRRANGLAHRLIARGVGAETLVGLVCERSIDLVIGILGILKAGGAYLPLDPAYPKDRVTFMLEDAQVAIVVTQNALAASLSSDVQPVLVDEPGDEPGDDPPLRAMPSSLAYVIYTSGSTGQPKGVLVTHYNVIRLFETTDAWFAFDAQDVWTLFHSYAFDFSVWEFWGALLYGGRLVVVPSLVSRAPDDFLDLLYREGVTVLNQTPSAFRALNQADAGDARRGSLRLRYVIFGGEALELQGLRPWFVRHGDERPRLINMYGITETTVHVTYREIRFADVEAGTGSLIGVPLPDLEVHLLDANGEPVPIGVAGEIYVGGAGVARGYLRRPELTAARFVRDRFSSDPEARLYRSGDLARRRPDGELEYLGRIDHQVKIRGFRIELGEIEAVLSRDEEVYSVAVIAREDSPGEKRLAAYVVAGGDRSAVGERLRRRLHTNLPEYMIPASLVFLDAMPLTENGKVERAALPAPDTSRPELEVRFQPLLTESQATLAGIWSSVLGIERVGLQDNFFDLGGDSLMAARMMGRVRKAFGVDMPLRRLFEARTLAALAELAEAARWAAAGAGAPRTPDEAHAREELEL